MHSLPPRKAGAAAALVEGVIAPPVILLPTLRDWPPALELQRHASRHRPLRFALSLRSGAAGAWTFIFLGAASTLTQHRIDVAVASLELRYGRWLLAGDGPGVAKALCRLWARPAPGCMRVALADVLAWSGRGTGVLYRSAASSQDCGAS